MRRCCFLSMDSLAGYTSDDELAIAPLRDLGWTVETFSWRDRSVDWNDFEAVVIRTTWDYQRAPEEFLRRLREIDASKARLENPLSIVEWNFNKLYLRDLERAGIKIVPTAWSEGKISEQAFESWQARFQSGEIIVKPLVSATAEHTYRLAKFSPELKEVFERRAFMAQPFMASITAEGEYSLFYFGGEYSHAILKTPKEHDFRVQEEHGGLIRQIAPEKKLLAAARKAFAFVRPVPLYARIDFVRDSAGDFRVMELELIEPALYFRMDEEAPRRFARAFHAWMKR